MDGSDAAAKKPKGKIEIFRFDGGTSLDECMPLIGMDDSVNAGLAKVNEVGDISKGSDVRVLFREPHEGGLSLAYAWFKSGYVLPRHSHNADCLYYVIAGELKMGTVVLRKGDGMFIPCDAGYTYEAGPDGVEILEFRNATNFHFLFKGNDPTQWGKVAQAVARGMTEWPGETLRPSDQPKRPAAE